MLVLSGVTADIVSNVRRRRSGRGREAVTWDVFRHATADNNTDNSTDNITTSS